MSINILAEIALLKKLKDRFSNNDLYVTSVQDMYEEGLITPKAFREIINWLTKTTVPKQTVKVLKKGIPTSAKRTVEIDPCSRGSYSRSAC